MMRLFNQGPPSSVQMSCFIPWVQSTLWGERLTWNVQRNLGLLAPPTRQAGISLVFSMASTVLRAEGTVVHEALDFTRLLRCALAPVDLNSLFHEAWQAAPTSKNFRELVRVCKKAWALPHLLATQWKWMQPGLLSLLLVSLCVSSICWCYINLMDASKFI